MNNSRKVLNTFPTPHEEELSSSNMEEKVVRETLKSLKQASLHSADAYWSSAFQRHKGFFTNYEQDKLRNACVAIAGLGGVGGTVFIGLVRSGVGNFILADYDVFELVNFNRQTGARPDTLGRKKMDVLIEEALRINPFINIRKFPQGLNASNIEEFLQGASIVVDAMDFFAYNERLTLLLLCRKKNLFLVTSGNAGFGSSLLVFDPDGMELEKFLGVSLNSNQKDLMAAFALAWIPRQLNSDYTDPCYVSLESKVAPATWVASALAGAMIVTEVLRLLVHHKGVSTVPHFVQVDVHDGKYVKGILRWGNRSLWQRIRRHVLINRYWGKLKGFKPVPPPNLPQERVKKLPVPERIIRAILTAGIQAPSGDNIQPWTFHVTKEKIRIEINENIDHSYFNYRQIPSFLSAGAVLENMRVSASSYGLFMEIESLGKESKNHIATVSFKLSDEPRDIHFGAIWERNTNRREYSKRKVSGEVLTLLKNTALHHGGVIWHEASDLASIKKLAKAMFLMDIIRTERKDLHLHLHKMLRFTPEKVYSKPDGLPLRNLKAGLSGELFLRFTHSWNIMRVLNFFGFANLVASFSYKELVSSSSVILLTVKTLDSAEIIKAGQALERVWLEATNNDLAFQPMAGLPIFLLRRKMLEDQDMSERHKKMLDKAAALEREAFPDFDPETENQVMFFRIGYAEAIEIGTLRRALDSFLK